MILSFKAETASFLNSITLKFVAFEGSLIDEGVADEFAIAVCIVQLELSFIKRTIFSYVGSFALRFTLAPLTKVDASIAFVDFS
jgi:hypothetical protein